MCYVSSRLRREMRTAFLSVFGKKVFNILIYVLKIFNKYRFSLSRYSYFQIKFVNLQRENQTKLNVKLQNYEKGYKKNGR